MSENHNHEHINGENLSKEEAVAMLKYMAEHNRHHAQELHELSHALGDSVSGLLHKAVDELKDSAALIEKALEIAEE